MKMNVENLREKMKNDSKKGGGKKENDPRFLNYYNMEVGDKMTIRFLPASEDDDIFLSYEVHGPNLKQPGVKAIRCIYESDGESCPVCAKSYGLWKEGNKDDAKFWRSKETFIAQCVVVESKIEINESEDGNPVKMMYLPFKVKEMIRNAIINGQVDDPCDRDFVLVKSENSGGFASYDNSFFKGVDSDIPEVILEAFDNDVAYLYDLEKEMPARVSEDDLAEWLVKAEEKVEGGSSSRSTTSRKKPESKSEDDGAGSAGEPEPEEEQEQKSSSSASSIRDRLRNRARK